MPVTDLPDINVWLALCCEDHQHHARARQYWEGEGAPRLAFCRVTMLGLLRLATNAKVMRDRPFTPPEAWKIYRDFMALSEVVFFSEATDVEVQFSAYSESEDFSASRWTDAYLAAFAQNAGCRLVSFDAGFHHFRGLDFFHLRTA